MRVKVGDTWYESTIGCPIAVELSVTDVSNIQELDLKGTVYASFHDADPMTEEEMKQWVMGENPASQN